MKNLIRISLAGLLLALLSGPLHAELKLPSGGDRKPDLNLDPFERAREAIRRLPKREEPAEEKAPPPTPAEKVERRQEAEPARPMPEPPPSVVEHEGEAFSQEFVLTLDTFAVTAGGAAPESTIVDGDEVLESPATNATVGLAEYVAEIDTGAAGLWNGGLFNFHFGATFGSSPSDMTGDVHGLSSIDAGYNTVKLLEAWYEHTFRHSHTSVLFGIADYNADFYVSEYANLFINGAFGMGTAIGNGGPAAYPDTGLGLRVKTDLSPSAYLQWAIFDGVPDDTGAFADVSLSRSEGWFGGVEAGSQSGEPGGSEGYYKVAVGTWYAKRDGVATLEEPIRERPGIHGYYILAETSIGESMGVFFKYGHSSNDVADAEVTGEDRIISDFYAAGITYSGLIPGRDDDVLGLGVVQSKLSPAFTSRFPPDYTPAPDGPQPDFVSEVAFELTYTMNLMDWLAVQPDLQYVQRPGMQYGNGNAAVVGVRLQAVY